MRGLALQWSSIFPCSTRAKTSGCSRMRPSLRAAHVPPHTLPAPHTFNYPRGLSAYPKQLQLRLFGGFWSGSCSRWGEPGSSNVTARAVTAPHANLVGTVAVTRVADPSWHPPGPGWPPSLAEPPLTQQGRGLHSLSLSHHGGVVWHCPG